MGAYRSHERELQKIALLRKLDLLERVSTDVEDCTEAWRGVSRRLATAYAHGNLEARPMDTQLWNLVQPIDANLLEAQKAFGRSTAGLRLIGANDAVNSLMAFFDAIAKARNAWLFRRQLPSHADFKGTQKEIALLREAFDLTLQKNYTSLT